MSATAVMARRIVTLYAWIASASDSSETIAAVVSEAAVKPLVAADRAGAESLRSLQTVRLKMFTAGVTIETIG